MTSEEKTRLSLERSINKKIAPNKIEESQLLTEILFIDGEYYVFHNFRVLCNDVVYSQLIDLKVLPKIRSKVINGFTDRINNANQTC